MICPLTHHAEDSAVYQKYDVQTMSVIPYLSGTPCIYTCSMDVARQIVSVKGQLEKPYLGSAFVR